MIPEKKQENNSVLGLHKLCQERNVVISGLPEADEGDADSNNLADRHSFSTICEQYLEVKPALSNKGCVRLGRYDQTSLLS